MEDLEDGIDHNFMFLWQGWVRLFLVRNGDVLKLQGLIFLIVLRAAKMHQIQGNIF